MEGEIRGQALVETLRSLGRQRKTGILTVQGVDEIIAFSFLDGSIVGADALNQSLEEGLGDVLASQHLIDHGEFARLAAEQEAGGGRVVDLLVERSFLSRSQLLESLRLQIYRLCLEAISWSAGEYRFYQGDEVAYEPGVPPLEVSELLVRASEELGEAGPFGGRKPDQSDRYSRTAEAFADEPVPRALGGASAEAQAALKLLDGSRTLEEVAAEANLSAFEAKDLASELLEAGVVERLGSEATPASPAASQPSDFGDQLLEPGIDLDAPEVLVPPPPTERGQQAERPRRRAAAARRSWEPGLEGVMRWGNRVFGTGLLVASLMLLAVNAKRIILPFPWQGSLRDGLSTLQARVERVEIEDGANTFFLLRGRYPDSLAELRELGVISPTSRRARQGSWQLSAGPTSLVLQLSGDLDVSQPSWTTAIADNFLLDPGFRELGASSSGPLLVLLD